MSRLDQKHYAGYMLYLYGILTDGMLLLDLETQLGMPYQKTLNP